MITKIFRDMGSHEVCFYIESDLVLGPAELEKLRWIIAETFEPELIKEDSSFESNSIVEIGPRLNVETPFSTNAVAICEAMGLDSVTRIEVSKLYRLNDVTKDQILGLHLDKMTQSVYPEGGINSFDLNIKPEEVKFIPVLEQGKDALDVANKEIGLGMDDFDIEMYMNLFRRLGRNPSNVELLQLGNANSEHSRHWYFKGKMVIDGKEMPRCLMDIIQAPLEAVSERDVTILAFNDNVGALRGSSIEVLVPITPGAPSGFRYVSRVTHHTATAETHNHPTLISPYEGAATKVGGRIRDGGAGGSGSKTGFGNPGICVGNLFVPDYQISGEVVGGEETEEHATPLRILLEGSDGYSDYGNRYGEPQIGGFTRAFCQIVSGERREFRKPVMYGAGVGFIDEKHTEKATPKKHMLIVAIGGPAYAIGEGGGAASSMVQGYNDAELDFKSVQRGDGEMGNKAVRVIRACIEMGDDNPIESIHDQGAGGPSNVLTELMGEAGGQIDIRKIVPGDKTMSVFSLWSAEYQERYGLLLEPENIDLFRDICKRERVNYEVLGEITGDGHVTVIDSDNDTKPVHLNLDDILGKLPQKMFESTRIEKTLEPFEVPTSSTLEQLSKMVLGQLSVGSKGFLVRKVDRSVGGLVVQQQCCGAPQIPIANVSVLADSFVGNTGVASALGEQPIKMLIDSAAGARMAVGEMITNLMSVGGIDLSDIRCRANWMWAAKLPHEGPLLYDAAVAMSDFMIALRIACDGGKDSLSMAATVNDELVKAPGQLVVLGYASVPNIEKVLTPDVKRPGETCLGLIDLGFGKNRLGGSAIAQSFNAIGDDTPDCDPNVLASTWRAIQILHDKGYILSMHDRSDGGLFTTIVEMCLGGNCGLIISMEAKEAHLADPAILFSEELGLVIEYDVTYEQMIEDILNQEGAPPLSFIGATVSQERQEKPLKVFGIELTTLRGWWEATSHHLELLQTENGVANEEFNGYQEIHNPVYHVSFDTTPKQIVEGDPRPKVAILREEGSNGDREMTAAFYTAGLDPYDVTMSDLLDEKISLDEFQGLVATGGFSYMDVFGSAKGWAGVIKHNPYLRKMFDRFYNREDTFSLGVCNGCQLFALLGWVPFSGLDETAQPRFIQNRSERFESQWSQVKIQPSPSVLLAGMEGSTLGIHVAHGEGRLVFPDSKVLDEVQAKKLAPMFYVNSDNEPTEKYPFNPNGSGGGLTALCSPDGRHLAMMPHPERCFLKWQWAYMPESLKKDLSASPWLRMFENAKDWCLMQNQVKEDG